jgi:hypothetical protein
MGLQIFGELLEGLGILAWGSEEQTLGLEVHKQGDVIVATPAAGFIDTDGVDLGHVHGLAGFGDVMIDHPPEALVRLPHHPGDRQHRHLPDHGHDQGLKEQRKSRSFPGPRDGH